MYFLTKPWMPASHYRSLKPILCADMQGHNWDLAIIVHSWGRINWSSGFVGTVLSSTCDSVNADICQPMSKYDEEIWSFPYTWRTGASGYCVVQKSLWWSMLIKICPKSHATSVGEAWNLCPYICCCVTYVMFSNRGSKHRTLRKLPEQIPVQVWLWPWQWRTTSTGGCRL